MTDAGGCRVAASVVRSSTMASPSSARCPVRDGRKRQQIPAHFGSLAALVVVVREQGDGAHPIRCAARYLELPAPQSSGPWQGVWGVLVTARTPCTAGRGEATLSAWIVAEELPRAVATVRRREAAWAHLADLHDTVRKHLEASGFTGQTGQNLAPAPAFPCRAHYFPAHGRPSFSLPVHPMDIPTAHAGTPHPSADLATDPAQG